MRIKNKNNKQTNKQTIKKKTRKQLLGTSTNLLHDLQQIKNVLVNSSQCVHQDLLSPTLIKTFVK